MWNYITVRRSTFCFYTCCKILNSSHQFVTLRCTIFCFSGQRCIFQSHLRKFTSKFCKSRIFNVSFFLPSYFLRLYDDTLWTIDRMLIESFVSCHWIILWHHFARYNYLFVFRNVLGTSINANSLLDRWGFVLFVFFFFLCGGGG